MGTGSEVFRRACTHFTAALVRRATPRETGSGTLRRLREPDPDSLRFGPGNGRVACSRPREHVFASAVERVGGSACSRRREHGTRHPGGPRPPATRSAPLTESRLRRWARDDDQGHGDASFESVRASYDRSRTLSGGRAGPHDARCSLAMCSNKMQKRTILSGLPNTRPHENGQPGCPMGPSFSLFNETSSCRGAPNVWVPWVAGAESSTPRRTQPGA
jgi:hypothetical protein